MFETMNLQSIFPKNSFPIQFFLVFITKLATINE